MIKKYNLGLLIASTLLSHALLAQESRVTKYIELPMPPTAYSVDSENNFYLGYPNGTLVKYDTSGDELEYYSLPNQSSITLAEAQNNRRIFLFQRDIQQITILDRFSTIPKQYALQAAGIAFALMACPSQDGQVWVLENNPQRLKKIDLLRNIVVQEVQIQLGDSISSMRTKGNLLFVASSNNLQILDQFGNLLQKIALSSISYLQIKNDYILASHPGGLEKINPHTAETTNEYAKTLNEGQVILKLNKLFVVIDKKGLSFISM